MLCRMDSWISYGIGGPWDIRIFEGLSDRYLMCLAIIDQGSLEGSIDPLFTFYIFYIFVVVELLS